MKYVPVETIEGNFCIRRKPGIFCHSGHGIATAPLKLNKQDLFGRTCDVREGIGLVPQFLLGIGKTGGWELSLPNHLKQIFEEKNTCL